MKLGNKIYLFNNFIFFFNYLNSEEIKSTPLINIEKIKPSFEVSIEENENILNQKLKTKK